MTGIAPADLLPGSIRMTNRMRNGKPVRRAVRVDDRDVSPEIVIGVALRGERVELSSRRTWRSRVRRSRLALERALRAGERVYGVSTGVGNSSSRPIAPREQISYARSIMEQHGCGTGEPLSEAEGRAVVFARLVSLSKGYSAVRFSLLEAMRDLLNRDVIPAIPRLGSVGASGDLTPLSYVAAVMNGGREAWHRGKIVPARRALRAAGLAPFVFAPKETLAIMNGTSVGTALGLLAIERLERIVGMAERASALAAEVLYGRSQAFDPRVHARKPHPGQITSARNIRSALRGSRLLDPPHIEGRPVQDRYSIRCSPQVLGAARDALAWARHVLGVELNSVNDNPLVDPDDGSVLFGGNFYGGHVALAMDLIKITAASTADLVDRQFALLVESPHNMGLPETLVPGGGCGVKGLQVTCSALTALAVQRSAPDSTLSRSTECANQDKVSMGMNAALNASEVVGLLSRVLGTELIALSNAARLRNESRLSTEAHRLLRSVRALSPLLDADRPLDEDLARIAAWVGSGAESR